MPVDRTAWIQSCERLIAGMCSELTWDVSDPSEVECIGTLQDLVDNWCEASKAA
jgi:hypothetical protein